MITVSDLALSFNGQNLFSHVNLLFQPGNCYGVIGANGAGKSTFLKILSGELEPTKGEVVVDEKSRMSVLKQDHFAYEQYTVFETILQGNPRLYEVLKEKDALYEKEDFSEEDGIRAAIRERCAGLREIPATPLAVEMGNARVFNSVMMGGLAQLVGGDADVWRSVIADRVAPKVRDLNVRAFDAGLNHTF